VYITGLGHAVAAGKGTEWSGLHVDEGGAEPVWPAVWQKAAQHPQHTGGVVILTPREHMLGVGKVRQPAGMVVNAAPGPSGVWSALVEVKLTALDGGTLHLGSADGPVLQARALPYALA